MDGVGEGEAVLYITGLLPFSRDRRQTASCEMKVRRCFPLILLNHLCFKARQELPVLKGSILLLLEQGVLEMDTLNAAELQTATLFRLHLVMCVCVRHAHMFVHVHKFPPRSLLPLF